MQHLLSNLDTGGLLGPQIQPLLARLSGLLGAADNPAEELQRCIRIQSVGAREFHLDHFQAVGSALLRRKRLIIRFHARGTDAVSEREVSPQRLNHYRDHWHLDAWCHLRDGLRAFAVDAIEHAEILDKRAMNVAHKRLDEMLGSGYGVFSGEQVAWTVLRFTPERARWVTAEHWHRKQEGGFLEDGRYELRLPYADDRELIMDIMKYGSDCEVIEPETLKARVAAEFELALARYRQTATRPTRRGRRDADSRLLHPGDGRRQRKLLAQRGQAGAGHRVVAATRIAAADAHAATAQRRTVQRRP